MSFSPGDRIKVVVPTPEGYGHEDLTLGEDRGKSVRSSGLEHQHGVFVGQSEHRGTFGSIANIRLDSGMENAVWEVELAPGFQLDSDGYPEPPHA